MSEQVICLTPGEVLPLPEALTTASGAAIDARANAEKFTTRAVLDAEQTTLDAATTPVAVFAGQQDIDDALARHEQQAAAVVGALRELGGDLPLVAAPGAVVIELAGAAGLPVVREGFADRAYLADGTLAPRSLPGAVLTAAEAVAAQALSIATEHGVRTADGSWVELPVRSLCLHGDTPGAVELARTVRRRLEAAGVRLAAAL